MSSKRLGRTEMLKEIWNYKYGAIFFVSIALLASTYNLIRTLKSNHADEMVREADVLMGLFITYALSYFVRALFFVGLGKYGRMWQNVFPTWSCSKI